MDRGIKLGQKIKLSFKDILKMENLLKKALFTIIKIFKDLKLVNCKSI
jgi:hypothetical protein